MTNGKSEHSIRVKTLECDNLIVHQKEKAWRKIVEFVVAFLIGLAITFGFHLFTLNREVRKTAEKVCEVFARDELECKNGLDSISEMVESEAENPVDF